MAGAVCFTLADKLWEQPQIPLSQATMEMLGEPLPAAPSIVPLDVVLVAILRLHVWSCILTLIR